MTRPSAEDGDSPQFCGLFIGINKYESPAIWNLAAAVRDAQALRALFSDNLGGNCTLVIDSEATTERLRRELRDLQAQTSDEDVVVITFSGHGSDTHELVTFDTNPDDLPGTALPLDEFTDLISAIPAKHQAWEDVRLCHGYLSYFLLEALLGLARSQSTTGSTSSTC